MTASLSRISLGAFGLGALGAVACLLGPWAFTRSFYASYLTAYVFWMDLSLGCLAVIMLHHLVGGGWGRITRPFLEAGARTLPLMALLSLPILLGLSTLYPWAGTDPVAMPENARRWLREPFFVARSAVYFVSWIALLFFVLRWSGRLERRPDEALGHRLRLLCAAGLAVYGVTVFFASVDWILSLEPGWPSTIYGMIVMAGQGLSALAAVTALAGAFSRRPPLSDAVTPDRLNDLGNLLLTFVMLWAYVAFSQYLIIWYGDLPRENGWYLRRTAPGWDRVAIALLVFHFALPFLLLLFRRVKRSRVLLPIVAAALVAIHALDDFWRIRPSLAGPILGWTDLFAPLALGGFWVGAAALHLRRRPPPSLEEVRHA